MPPVELCRAILERCPYPVDLQDQKLNITPVSFGIVRLLTAPRERRARGHWGESEVAWNACTALALPELPP